MIDEGYIKFNMNWEMGPAFRPDQVMDLMIYRDKLVMDGWIGYDEKEKVGFGNISQRWKNGHQFVISGTQTGDITKIGSEHFSLVSKYHIARNSVNCVGPIRASSEAMSHAACYSLDRAIVAVIHIHDNALHEKWIDKLPTTDKLIKYGTVEMAYDIRRLYIEKKMFGKRIIIMGGHKGGIIAYGESLESVYEDLKTTFRQ